MSTKIPPSERIRQLLEGYLQGGYQQSEQPASEFLKLAAQLVAQEALEEEAEPEKEGDEAVADQEDIDALFEGSPEPEVELEEPDEEAPAEDEAEQDGSEAVADQSDIDALFEDSSEPEAELEETEKRSNNRRIQSGLVRFIRRYHFVRFEADSHVVRLRRTPQNDTVID